MLKKVGAISLAAIVVFYAVWHLTHSKPALVTTEAPIVAEEPKAEVPDEAITPPPAATPTGLNLAVATESGFSSVEEQAMRSIHARFATGDFVGALRLADEHALAESNSAEFHEWLVAQLPVLLTSAGWARLKLGDCDEATLFLRRAEALKRSPETTKGLAVCYYKQKNLAAAREQFSLYLDKNTGDLAMQTLYADVLESESRFDEAVTVLEQDVASSETAPVDDTQPKLDTQSLKQRLESMRARAKEGTLQQVETSRNFRLAYRAGEHEDLVAFVMDTLEGALDEYVENYGFRPPPAPIEVVLYPADGFRNIVVGGPEWAEGLFDGRLRIPVKDEMLRTRNFRSLTLVLRHELVHALFALMSDSRAIPSWFDEGMAQRLSCAAQGCGTFQFPPTPGQFLASQAFFTPYTSFSATNAGRAYQQSLYLIQTLERQYGEDALRRLASGITVSSDLSGDGLLAPLGTTFKDLHQTAGTLWKARQPLSSR